MICRTCKAQMEEVSRKELPMCDVVQRRCACGIQEAMEVTSDRWQSTMGSLGSAYFGMKKLREDEGEKKERETVAKLKGRIVELEVEVETLRRSGRTGRSLAVPPSPAEGEGRCRMT